MSLDCAPADRLRAVDSGNGHSVDRGGAGEPLVLIHGFSGTRLMWEPVLEALERSHDVLAVNLAGHVGGPELGDTPVSVNALVDAVERDLDAAGFDTAHVVGNSLGGWIAFELAARGRARSVVALAPAGGWEQGSRAERRLPTLFTRNHKLSTALLPRIDSLMRRPRLRRALLWQVAAHGERIPPAAAAQMVRDSSVGHVKPSWTPAPSLCGSRADEAEPYELRVHPRHCRHAPARSFGRDYRDFHQSDVWLGVSRFASILDRMARADFHGAHSAVRFLRCGGGIESGANAGERRSGRFATTGEASG
jgi:pimeloyl-ACP methyl ester carboxylesterase